MRKSIRWRLSLSFAGIALLAALLSGALLLTILRNYYTRLERDYLSQQAHQINQILQLLYENEAPQTEITSTLHSFAFLSRTQVKLFDPDGELLADTGEPTGIVEFRLGGPTAKYVYFSGEAGMSSLALSETAPIEIIVEEQSENPDTNAGDVWIQATPEVIHRSEIVAAPQTGQTDFTQDVNGVVYLEDAIHSKEIVQQSIQSASGDLLGAVELSNGPAYGQTILRSVAIGWAIASTVAVILAIIVGYIVSRKISQPVVALTAATQKMAGGDLNTRVQIENQDEFGSLGSAFNTMANQIKDKVHSMQHFVADAAHGINTPITALRTNLELLHDGKAQHNSDEIFAQAKVEIDRLEKLAQNLLTLSKLESEELSSKKQRTDLFELLQGITEIYASQAEQKGITFQTDFAPTDTFINADAGQIRNAFANLLENAIKFTPAAGTIWISSRLGDDAVEITVKDTGIGIPTEDLARLFSRFHRGRNAASFPGSGLGLAIVQSIVEHHGGTVIGRNWDQGALFSIELPFEN